MSMSIVIPAGAETLRVEGIFTARHWGPPDAETAFRLPVLWVETRYVTTFLKRWFCASEQRRSGARLVLSAGDMSVLASGGVRSLISWVERRNAVRDAIDSEKILILMNIVFDDDG